LKRYFVINTNNGTYDDFDSLEKVSNHVNDMDIDEINDSVVVHGTLLKVKRQAVLTPEED